MATRGALERFRFPPVAQTLRARARFGKPNELIFELTPKRVLLSIFQTAPGGANACSPIPGASRSEEPGTHRHDCFRAKREPSNKSVYGSRTALTRIRE